MTVSAALGQGALRDILRDGQGSDLHTELSAALQLPVAAGAVHFRELLETAADDPLADVQLRGAFPDWLRQQRARTVPVDKRHILALTAAALECRESVPTLLDWLADPTTADRAFRREVLIDSLGRIGDDRAVPALQAATEHADEWTRFFAHEALARIAGTFEEPAPVWPGARGLRLAVVGASVWGGPVHLFYRTLMREAFEDGKYTESYAGWRAHGYERILQDVAFDEQGQPSYTVLILHALQPEQTTGELMWRLYHYVRRGGRLIIDRPSLFWPDEEGAVYEPGPWDRLFPDPLERHPRFPSVDGLPPPRRLARHAPTPLKSLYYGYRPIGRGGVLMIARQNRTLAQSTREAVPYSATEGFLEPVSNHVRPALRLAIPQILHWLTEGPTWKAATVDWRDEPAEVPAIEAGGAPFPLTATVTVHGQTGALTPRVTVRDPRGAPVFEQTAPPVSGDPGDTLRVPLRIALDVLSEKGDYTLEVAITDDADRELHAWRRTVAVANVMRVALAAPSSTESFYPVRPQSPPPYSVQAALQHRPAPVIRRLADEDSPARASVAVTVSGPAGLAVPEGELRLWIVNPDTARRYAVWRQPWDGMGRDAEAMSATFEIAVPPGLPAGQYRWLAELGDRAGRVFAEAAGPLAVPAHYRDRQAMLWHDWAADYENTPEGAQPRLDIGFNTSHQNGAFRGLDGFPYEYAIINMPPRTVGVHLGDRYIDNRVPNTDRRRIIASAENARANAKAMSVNILDETSVFDQIDWRPRRRRQIRIFLQDNLGDIATFNAHTGADIASWDEAFFGLQTGTNTAAIAFLSRWFHYEHRDSVIRMHGDWLREGNPYLQIEPGMGAGGDFYDAMHMRGYSWHNMAWFPKARQPWLGIHGRAQMTWLMGMRSETRFPPMARVAWSAVAGGGRNMLLYAPGDHLGRRLFHPDGRLTPHGEAYAEVIRAIRPYEPALVHVQNAVREDVLNLGAGGPHLDLLFRMGIQPAQSSRLTGRRVILNAGSAAVDGADVRRAVEAGAICLMLAPGDPALAAAFGVQVPDATARGEALRVDLTPLDALLPGMAGRALRGHRGPATGVAPDSGLTATPGLIFGRVGDGLFVYLNLDLTFVQHYQPENDPLDLADAVRLMEAILRRADVTPPALIVDTTGEPDARFMVHTLDTDDGTQRYLLIQANDILEGSLSSWGLAEREADLLATSALTAPVDLGPGRAAAEIVLRWDQDEATEAIVWIERELAATPEAEDVALELYLTRDGNPVPAPTRDRRTGELNPPTPIGNLRAFTAAGRPVWEAAGPFLPLEPGTYELRIRPPAEATRSVRVHAARVMPATVTARVVLLDDSLAALFDPRDQTIYPPQSGDGYRYVEIPLRAGDGALLSLLENTTPAATADALPTYRMDARVEAPHPRAGHPVAIEAIVRDASGNRVPGSHTLQAHLLDAAGQPIPATQTTVLARRGRAVFDFWIGASDTPGRRQLEIRDFTTGASAVLELRVVADTAPRDQQRGTGILPVSHGRDAHAPNSSHGRDAHATLAIAWRLDQPPVLGGSVNGVLRLANRGHEDARLSALTLDGGGAVGMTVTPARAAITIPAAGTADIPFDLTLDRNAEAGPSLIRLLADGLPATTLPALDGLLVNVPPPAEFEIDDFPDLRAADLAMVDITGRIRNRTAAPLTVHLEPTFPVDSIVGGAAALRMTVPPGEWTPIRIPALLTPSVTRQARERDLSVPMWLTDSDGHTLALARPRLPINPWDAEPPRVDAVDDGALRLAVLNATGTSQPLTLAFDAPGPASRPDAERVAADAIARRDANRSAHVLAIANETVTTELPPHTTTPVRVPARYRPFPGSDGIYRIGYRATGADGARAEGYTRVETQTRTRWWMHVAADVLAPSMTAPTLGGMGSAPPATDPWHAPEGLFEVRTPPAGWTDKRFDGGLPLHALQPPAYAIVTAVTRVIAEAPAEVKIRVAYETPHFLMVDGEVLEDRRSGDERKAAPRGFKPAFFDGRIRLNGNLVYDSRSAAHTQQENEDILGLDILTTEAVAASGTLNQGANTLMIQAASNLDAHNPPGLVYVWFVDSTTGERVYPIGMDMRE